MKSPKLPSGLKLSVEQPRISVSENAWLDWIPVYTQWYLEGELRLTNYTAIRMYNKGLALTVRSGLPSLSNRDKSKVTVKIPIREIAARRIIAHQARQHG
jgi:hypothetical protein